MSARGHGLPQVFHCAPCRAAQHGPGGGLNSGRIDPETFHDDALSAAVPLGRFLFISLITLISPLLGMSADKLGEFPGDKPPAAQVQPTDLEELTRFLEDDFNGNRVVVDCSASQERNRSCPSVTVA